MAKAEIHVLLIRNNFDDTLSIKSILSKCRQDLKDFRLTSFNNLSDAFSFIAETNIDIILLDFSLSDNNRIDSFIRLNDFASDIPIVILCDPDNKKIAIEAVERGAQDYLVKKGIGWQLLERVIHYAIERKQTELKLIAANEKLKMLDQLKNEFLSTVSHELRTPIAIMREGVSLCLDRIAGDITETQHDLLTSTLENIDRLAMLVSDLIDVSQIETEKLNLKKSSLDVCQIINDIFEEYEQQIHEAGISFIRELPDKPVRLFADAEKIYQIIGNIVSNAIRYTGSKGEIRVHLGEKKDIIECSVSDTGVGIAEKNIPKLFAKFQQFGRVEGPGYKGTGLGLAIVKGLVEMHGGKVWVESQLGKGTTIRFTLKKGPFPRLLIVDDEKTIVNIIKRVLCDDKYRFREAFEGEEAIEIVQKEHISLIILDIVLPGMSGYEVIGRLKQDVRTNNIPILISSGYTVDTNLLSQVDIHGAIPIIRKPIEPVELRSKVKKMLMSEKTVLNESY